MKKSTPRERFLRKFLEKLPAFQAVFRAVEAEGIVSYTLKEPILDLGCGDGIFTEVVLGKGKEIVGVDIDEKALAQAKKKGFYQKLVKADAQSLPFKNDQFKTVLANSSLEHIRNLKPVLKEIQRVLAKKGLFVLTAPSEKRKKLFGGYQFFADLGMLELASRIGDFENKLFNHFHCWSGKKWQKELLNVGFRKVSYQYKCSPQTALIGDLLLIGAPLGFLEKKIFGCHLGWRKYLAPLSFLFLRKFKDRVEKENGAGIIVRAEK